MSIVTSMLSSLYTDSCSIPVLKRTRTTNNSSMFKLVKEKHDRLKLHMYSWE